MSQLLFILGLPGVGKTTLAQAWVKEKVKEGQAWCLIDKDEVCPQVINAFMTSEGLDWHDRDSQAYQEKFRDLEYKAALHLIKIQLELGVNVAAPGPWTQELKNGELMSAQSLRLPLETELKHIYLHASPQDIKKSIMERKSPRDDWKMQHWNDFEKRLKVPQEVMMQNIPMMNGLMETKKQLIELESILKKQNMK